jgi:hypothetical protein
MKTLKRLALYALVHVISLLPAANAFSQADFYKGKTIKIIRGGGPGGSGEFQTRALMKFLEKYIPGQPRIMMEYIEGAAGRKAANVIYGSTKPDGLTIGSIGAGLVVGPILGLPGSNYDLDKFIYLGSTDTGDPYIFYTKASLGLDSLEKLRAASGLRLGAHAVGHPVYVTGRMVAYLLNLKEPKFVTGYTGPEILRGYHARRAGCPCHRGGPICRGEPRMDRKETGALPYYAHGPQGTSSPFVRSRARAGKLCQVGDGAQAARHVSRLPISALAIHLPSWDTQRACPDHP